MKIHEVKIYQEFDAPVEVAWEAFSDHANLGKMLGLKMERIVDSQAPGNINGAGSVRLIKVAFTSFEETIQKAVKPNCIEYNITRGTPLNHHYGKMEFKSLDGERSALDYSVTVGSNIPFLGALVKIGLQNSLGAGVAKYAKRLKKG